MSITFDQLIKQAGDSVPDSFEPLPAGDYELEVVEAKYKKTSTGKDMWNLQSKVISGEYANRRIFDNIVLSPENQTALGFFFRNMAVLGFTKEVLANNPTPDQIAAGLAGRRYRAKIGHRTYQGELQNEVTRYVAPLAAEALPEGVTPAPVAAATPPAASSPVPPQAAPPATGTTPPPLPF